LDRLSSPPFEFAKTGAVVDLCADPVGIDVVVRIEWRQEILNAIYQDVGRAERGRENVQAGDDRSIPQGMRLNAVVDRVLRI